MYNFGSKSLSLLISKKPKPSPDNNSERRIDSTLIKESQKFRVEKDELPSNIYQFYLLEMKGHLD